MIKWVLILTFHMGDPSIDLVAYSSAGEDSLKACQLAGEMVNAYFHADPKAAANSSGSIEYTCQQKPVKQR
jgi:hypothetical protein